MKKLPELNDAQIIKLQDRYETSGKIAAIRLVLDWTGCGIADAKECVERHALKGRWKLS